MNRVQHFLTSEYPCQQLEDLEARSEIGKQWCSWPKHQATHIWSDEGHLAQEFPSAHVPLGGILTHHGEGQNLTRSLSADVETLLGTLTVLYEQHKN